MRDFDAMAGVLLGVAAAALLVATALAVAVLLGIRSLSELLLAMYVVAFSEIVGLALLLSTVDAMTRTGFAVGVGALFVAAAGGWAVAGRPHPARPFSAVASVLARSRTLLVLAAVVALAFAYLLALLLATAPNSWDSLVYHLSRAAFWTQGEHVGYIPDAYDGRLNANPPNAEIALAFVLDLTRNERFTGLVQYFAALACATGVFVLARRLELPRREAAFGALVFLTLPVVLLQAPTTQNDLVAGSLLIAAAAFVTGTSVAALGLAWLATALAIGTKVPAVFGLPLLVALALAAPGAGRLRGVRLLAILAGTAVGAYWYAVNVHSSGGIFGPSTGTGENIGGGFIRPPKEALLTSLGLAADSFDLSGARGADILLYLVGAVAVTVVVLVVTRGSEHRVRNAVVAGILAALPLALYPGSYLAWRTFAKAHEVLSGSTWFEIRAWDPSGSGENVSWFGPLGLLLVVGVAVVAVVLVRRRTLAVRALLYAAAPLVWLLIVALTLAYNPWHGRLFIFPVALSAGLWGVAYRVRPVAWAVVTVAAATTVLSLVNDDAKPSGLRLLEGDPPASVWTMNRWETQAIQRPNLRGTLRFVEENVPRDARIALALGHGDFGYPSFGPTLSRTVLLAGAGSDGRDVLDADWIFASSAARSAIDADCWSRVFDDHDRWAVFRRRAGTCTS